MTPNALSSFSYNSLSVRVVTVNETPWFVAADVCKALGYTNATEMVRPLDADEKTKKFLAPGKDANFIAESGLYKIILRAQRTNPAAKAFQDWVTREVLPSIRKTGSYVTGQASLAENPDMDPLDLMMQQAQLIPKLIEQMKQMRQESQASAAKVAALEEKVAQEGSYLTVQEFLRTVGKHRSTSMGPRVKLGQIATQMCREALLSIRNHPFSGAGMYPRAILEKAAVGLL